MDARPTYSIEAVHAKTLSVKAASKHFSIPFTTLRRRLKDPDAKKPALGSVSCLGEERELKIVCHIKKLQAHGFAPSRKEVCQMAYGLAEKCEIRHKFNNLIQEAGKDWFILFMNRHPDLAVRKSEGVSQSRAKAMSRTEVSTYFQLLEKTLTDNNLMDQPGHIYNMDETGCQLNNRPSLVVAEKGSRNVTAITSAGRGETITVIACCNAEGNFLPPACVFKGKNKKAEFEDGMPPGSVVYMGDKSAYVNSDIFLTWLKDHFVPRKPVGKTILILDGHSSHCSNVEMLEFAVEHQIILLCLPPHTTHFLQPLDRSFFKSFKHFYYEACNMFVKSNPTRKLTRLKFGVLLSQAWTKSAIPANGISAFSATGIFPLNPDIIPEYGYIQSNFTIDERQRDQTTPPSEITIQQDVPETPKADASEITPGKMLSLISPIPSTSKGISKPNPRSQKSRVLTSQENLAAQKMKSMKRSKGKILIKKPKNVKKHNNIDDSTSEDEQISLHDDSDGPEDFGENICIGCGEDYALTTKPDEWLKCIMCHFWSHDSCTSYKNTCNKCGQKNKKKM